MWILTIIAALLIVLIEQSGLVVTFRIIEFPAETFREEYSFLDGIPGWAGWLVVIMISAVAGISEEIGFRGYMQLPLEKKYHPAIAISIVSIIFVLVHIHQAWSAPILFHIFMISALFGTLAYVSGSIIPGIIGHIIMDVFNYKCMFLGHSWDRFTLLYNLKKSSVFIFNNLKVAHPFLINDVKKQTTAFL